MAGFCECDIESLGSIECRQALLHVVSWLVDVSAARKTLLFVINVQLIHQIRCF